MKRISASLRTTLPLALLAVMLASVLVSYLEQRNTSRAEVLERAERALIGEAEHLARSAQADLEPRPHSVASDIAFASTDPRSDRIAVIDPAGRVLLSSRQTADGRAAVDALPGFDTALFAQAVRGQMPVTWRDASGRRVGVVMPTVLSRSETQLRMQERGAVWMAFDLSHELAMADHRARSAMLPNLGVAALMMLSLGLVLRFQVTRPLEQLEVASQELAESGQLAQLVPEVGPMEVRSLASSFNRMVRRTQEAQAESLAQNLRLSSFVSSAMDAIVTVDRDRRIVMVNPAAAVMFRVTEAELLGQPLESLLPERYRENHPHWVRRFGDSGVTTRQMSPQSVVYGRRWDGEEFPAEASISHADIQGERFFTVILRDVTLRQRAEDEVRALNTRLESTVADRTASLQATAHALALERDRLAELTAEMSLILDTATVGILLLRDRHVLRTNAKADELFGFAPGEAAGQSTRQWFPDDKSYEELGQALYTDLEAGRSHLREQQLLRRDGSLFWARISARRLERGDEMLVVAIIEDATFEHEAAETLAAAKVQAEAASQAKSRFLANMSHEIRTPMNAIIGMAHLALRTEMDDQQRDYLRKIQLSSKHLLGVINDILDFSKIEADKLTLERTDFQLLSVLDNVFALIADRAHDKGLELVLDVDAQVPNFLVGDPLRLGQVLINLGGNAVKFTQHGEVVVRVRPEQDDGAQVTLRFEVQDTGVGLSPEQAGRLFQSFHQADSSTSRQHGGTGLGLAISQHLAQMMGGEVGLQSEPGKGSTFWFTARFPKGMPTVPAPSPTTLRGHTVLAVDDNATARQVLAGLLRGLGLEVATACDGEEAVAQVRRAAESGAPFDFVLLDWQMPGWDGLEAGRRIRELSLSAPPRMMLVTGHGREAVMKEALATGFSTVMVKPVNASMLLDSLLLSLNPGAPPAVEHLQVGTSVLAEAAGRRVLVAEDNAINQQIARELLQDLGLVVDIAANGREALNAVEMQDYDLVFMDMHMPDMDGVTATRTLREDPHWAALPIIAMTANVMSEDRALCAAAGMNDFVAKPVDPEALAAVVRRWLPAVGAPPSVARPVPAAVSSDPRLAPLQRIAGLEPRAGLRRCAGNGSLYLSLLQRFIDSQSAMTEALVQAQASLQARNPDPEPLRLQVHSLKGVAGNLGATGLQRQCEALERQLRDDPPAALALVTPLLDTLQTLCAAVRQAVCPPPEAGSGPVADPLLVQSIVDRLSMMLRDGDPEALELAESHLGVLHQHLGPTATALVAKVRQFEFLEALTLLLPPASQ